MSHDPQNPTTRRAYVVRPLPKLLEHLDERGETDLAETLSTPSVVMTESLPHEGKLEGYRLLILGRCKTGFINDIREFLGDDDFLALFGDRPPADVFDSWWFAEEADVIQIDTDW